VVILHDVEGYELHETAEIIGLALGTVKSRLHHALEKLRRMRVNFSEFRRDT
jgi:RNA polymerase sigma-70 factor (ECF subfamily)